MEDYNPYPYQQYCIDRIVNDPAIGLFLDMGLGKTAIKSILEGDGSNPAYEHTVWCVDRGNNFNGMIDSRLFADYEPAKDYYNGIGEDSYRKIYPTPDIWNYLERTWKEGKTL